LDRYFVVRPDHHDHAAEDVVLERPGYFVISRRQL